MLSLIIPVLYTSLYALFGAGISWCIFPDMPLSRKIWFGLVFGLFGMTWMPSLFSFLTGTFSVASHIYGILLFAILFCIFLLYRKKNPSKYCITSKFDLKPLLFLSPLLLLGIYIFCTHILQEKAGGLYVGQSTYGDLAMHLGFISSIAMQGIFPPQYSIFPGHTINYPFLCEISASSLNLLGADLRTSYLISALYAYLLVIIGVYGFFKTWLRGPRISILASYLFFIGGGIGFAYFLDQTNGSASIANIINSSFQTNLSQLLYGYYTTPTNLPDLGLRWVNPIADMLVPQRATLFGWAFLFPCLTLLHEYTLNDIKQFILPLTILAGGLPLIHTHSFLALGVISTFYCLYDLISKYSKGRLRRWLIYGIVTIILACPQLFRFAFQQVSESSMVRYHFNWANEKDSWLWFYIKNWGLLFVMLFPGMIFLSKKDRIIMCGPILLWLLSEIIVFQPNTYDNNKLIFVFYAYLCGLCAKLLCAFSHKLKNKLSEADCYRPAFQRLLVFLSLLLIMFTISSYISSSLSDSRYIKQGSLLTILFFTITYAIFSVEYFLLSIKYDRSKHGIVLSLISFILFFVIVRLIFLQVDSPLIHVPGITSVLIFSLETTLLIISLINIIRNPFTNTKSLKILPYAFFRFTGLIVAFTLFLSGTMTLMRECCSSYEIFNRNDIQAAEYIKAETPSNSVFLTSYNWHLNVPSVLTGRSIVCGSDLYLFYHGIDTSERKVDIDLMFKNPGESRALFDKYQVSYVYIGSDERYSLEIDIDYFENYFEKVYDAGGIKIFKVPT